jgi:hypothetical protein
MRNERTLTCDGCEDAGLTTRNRRLCSRCYMTSDRNFKCDESKKGNGPNG